MGRRRLQIAEPVLDPLEAQLLSCLSRNWAEPHHQGNSRVVTRLRQPPQTSVPGFVNQHQSTGTVQVLGRSVARQLEMAPLLSRQRFVLAIGDFLHPDQRQIANVLQLFAEPRLGSVPGQHRSLAERVAQVGLQRAGVLRVEAEAIHEVVPQLDPVPGDVVFETDRRQADDHQPWRRVFREVSLADVQHHAGPEIADDAQIVRAEPG